MTSKLINFAEPHERALYKLHFHIGIVYYKCCEKEVIVCFIRLGIEIIHEESNLWRAVNQKPYNFWGQNWMWANKSRGTTYRPSFVEIRKGSFIYCVDLTWNDPNLFLLWLKIALCPFIITRLRSVARSEKSRLPLILVFLEELSDQLALKDHTCLFSHLLLDKYRITLKYSHTL